jgi:hypothetical protein
MMGMSDFTGYRTFRFSEGSLVGHYGQTWESAEMKATCGGGVGAVFSDPWGRLTTRPDHPAPDEKCECGIYAHKSPLKLTTMSGLVFAECSMWGTIIEGERGFRCENARIKRLWWVGDDSDWNQAQARFLEVKYGVPCGVATLEQFYRDTDVWEEHVMQEVDKANAPVDTSQWITINASPLQSAYSQFYAYSYGVYPSVAERMSDEPNPKSKPSWRAKFWERRPTEKPKVGRKK